MAKKGENKQVDKSGKLWKRYWAEQGVAVIHVDMLKIQEDEKLEDRIIRIKEVRMQEREVDGQKVQRMQGIVCHWIDKNMQPHVHMFHSKELIPFEIAKLGLGVVQDWIERNLNE